MDKESGRSPSGRASRASTEPYGLGHTATIPNASEVLSVEKLMAMCQTLSHIPLPPVFASHPLFPNDRALTFNSEGRDFVLAGPLFWEGIPKSEKPLPVHASIEVILSLDDPRNRELAADVFRALAIAMETAEPTRREAGLAR